MDGVSVTIMSVKSSERLIASAACESEQVQSQVSCYPSSLVLCAVDR